MRSRFSCSIVIGTVLLCVHVRGWQGEMDSLNSTKLLAVARMKDHADAAERSGQLAAFPSGWGHLWRGRQDLQAQLKEAAIRTNTYREAGLRLVARDAPGSAGRLCANSADVTSAAKRMLMVTAHARGFALADALGVSCNWIRQDS
jgi:hypothetical protein